MARAAPDSRGTTASAGSLEDLQRRVMDPKEGADVALRVVGLAAAVATVEAHDEARDEREVAEEVAAAVLHAGEPVL